MLSLMFLMTYLVKKNHENHTNCNSKFIAKHSMCVYVGVCVCVCVCLCVCGVWVCLCACVFPSILKASAD